MLFRDIKKKLKKSWEALAFKIVCYVVYAACRLLWLSYRFKFTAVENLQRARQLHPSGSVILAIWHEHAVPAILSHTGQPYCILVSSSKDGDLVDFVCRRVGQTTVRGSSTRGGIKARRELLEIIQRGFSIAITVDGPKGPHRRCKPGVVDLARQTGVPILPVSLSSLRPWTFKKSWDQHKVPRLFSSIIFRFGTPFMVPSLTANDDIDDEEEFRNFQLKVENELLHLQELAHQDLTKWEELPLGHDWKIRTLSPSAHEGQRKN